jgi:hypothetical protein
MNAKFGHSFPQFIGIFCRAINPAIATPLGDFASLDRGRVYFSANASYYIKLSGSLSWNFSLHGSWDNRPPGNLPGGVRNVVRVKLDVWQQPAKGTHEHSIAK